jgi:hypothetical protein
MKTKLLKLPDGGTIGIPMPPEFGTPPMLLALNGAGAIKEHPGLVYGIGIALGIFGAYLFLRVKKA